VMVPPTLADSTIQLATLVSSGSSLAGIVSTPVATLTEGVLKAMLFAKVKSAFLGIATVALLSTGVGVLAQSAGNGPAPDDRLKALERKLDRLIEVLGGSNRSAPAAVTLPANPASVPAAAPIAPVPPVPPRPPTAVVPPPVDNPLAAMPRDYAPNPPPPPTDYDPLAATSPPRFQGRGRASARSIPGQPQSLAGRIDSLEQRLGEFERRLGALERRLQHAPGGAAASGLPPGRAARDLTTDFVRRGFSAAAPVNAPPAPYSADASDAIPDRPPSALGGVPAAPPSADATDALPADTPAPSSPAPPAPPSAPAEPAVVPPSSDLFSPTPRETHPPAPPSDAPPSDAPR
jgi:hypothetical protein